MAKFSISSKRFRILAFGISALLGAVLVFLLQMFLDGGGLIGLTTSKLLPPIDEPPERLEPDVYEGREQFQGKSVPEIVSGLIVDEIPLWESQLMDLEFTDSKPELSAFPRFENRASVAGIQVIAESTSGFGGICPFDYDSDGLLDVAAIAPEGHIRLFRNSGNGEFADATESAGLNTIAAGHRILSADFNNDGKPDIFVARSDGWPNSLLLNSGEEKFEDATIEAGLLDFRNTIEAVRVDYDRDGWIDLFVVNRPSAEPSTRGSCQLYRNEGDGIFRDWSWELGISGWESVVDCAWGDFDGDGFPEPLLLRRGDSEESGDGPAFDSNSNTQEAVLMRAIPAFESRHWRFSEISASAGLAGLNSHVARTLDVDQDGQLDLIAGEPLRLFRNTGFGIFKDVTETKGLAGVETVSCLESADLDGDGHEDLCVGNRTQFVQDAGIVPEIPLRVFLNRGGDRFREVTVAGGFGILQTTIDAGAGDLDEDGDLDLLVAANWTNGALFENPGFEENASLTLDLEGVTANRSAVGARISMVVRDRDWILHRIERIADSSRVEIGLGEAAAIESLRIEWPVTGWPVSSFKGVPLNRRIRVREGEAEFEVIDRKPFRLGGGEREVDRSDES